MYELNSNHEIEKDLKLLLNKIYEDDQKIFIASQGSSIKTKLSDQYINQLKKLKFDIINDLENIDESINNIILIIETGKIQFNVLERFSKKLEFLKLNIDSLIILD